MNISLIFRNFDNLDFFVQRRLDSMPTRYDILSEFRFLECQADKQTKVNVNYQATGHHPED